MTDLPLTMPVHLTIMSALEELDSLDREESYLLERLRRAGTDAERKTALLRAIEDAPD